MTAMWTKICGITNLQDAQAVADAQGSAIGLNFYAKSQRYVTPIKARAIRDSVDGRTEVVGVFVNSSADEVSEIVDQTGLTAVQFHGDEHDDVLRRFHHLQPETAIIRAVRADPEACDPMIDALRQTARAVPLSAILVDACVRGEFGGTGERAAVSVVNTLTQMRELPRLILAGGLTADNVGAAVQQLAPWGVDTASGVETRPGIKDGRLVAEFIRNAGCDRTSALKLK